MRQWVKDVFFPPRTLMLILLHFILCFEQNLTKSPNTSYLILSMCHQRIIMEFSFFPPIFLWISVFKKNRNSKNVNSLSILLCNGLHTVIRW